MSEAPTSNLSSIVLAGNAFHKKYGREPTTATDSLWLNGYVAGADEIERLRELVSQLSEADWSVTRLNDEYQKLRAAASKVVQFQSEEEYAVAIEALDAALHPETAP